MGLRAGKPVLSVENKSGLDARSDHLFDQPRSLNNKAGLSFADSPPDEGPDRFDSFVVGAGDHRLVARGQLNQASKGCTVAHSHVGQDLAIQIDVGLLQPMHQAVVGQPIEPGGCVDTRDPQPTKVTLAIAAITVHIEERLHHRLMGSLPEAAFPSYLTLRESSNSIVSSSGLRPTFYPWHFLLL